VTTGGTTFRALRLAKALAPAARSGQERFLPLNWLESQRKAGDGTAFRQS
jgi:hypothetical protein